MPKSPALEQKDFARNALIESAGRNKVGNFIEVFEEEGGVATFLFENNQKGYVGWRWSITVYQSTKSAPATVSEIVLLPGPDSLVAPDWVPWSERLADYKALQIELEKQAALDAEDAEDTEDDEDEADESEIVDEIVDEDEAEDVASEVTEESAVTDLEEGESAEDDSEDTGRKPPRFLRRRKGFKIKKTRGKGKNPKD
jgi:hypothetical protein